MEKRKKKKNTEKNAERCKLKKKKVNTGQKIKQKKKRRTKQKSEKKWKFFWKTKKWIIFPCETTSSNMIQGNSIDVINFLPESKIPGSKIKMFSPIFPVSLAGVYGRWQKTKAPVHLASVGWWIKPTRRQSSSRSARRVYIAWMARQL